MNALQIVMILISSSTLLGYISARHLRVQPSVAILGMSLISIITLKLVDATLTPITYLQHVSDLSNAANFHSVLIDLMLPMLLFAGAASLRTNLIKKRAVEISILATVSTLLSMIIIGLGLHWLTTALQNPIPLIHCFLFGALISPTDPVAVVGMLKHANVEPEIEAKVAGESLFNDGIGIVMFLTIAQLIEDQTQAITLSSALMPFLTEVLGGLCIGIMSGLVCKRIMILQDTDTHTNLLISLFVVTGIYTLCNLVHISGALAVVACGLIISHHVEKHSHAKSVLRHFWGTLEEILNIKNAAEDNKNGKLKDKTFMITGKLNGISRAEVKSLIEENAGTTISGVSKKLNYLIVGEKPTKRKMEAAKNLKIITLDQKQFLTLINKTS